MNWFDHGTISFLMIKVLPTLFTLVTALAASWISLQQWRISKAKLKLDLFDKRYEIFLLIWNSLSIANKNFDNDFKYNNLNIENSKIKRLQMENVGINNILPKIEFIFGKEIFNYTKEIYKKLGDFDSINFKISHLDSDSEERNLLNKKFLDLTSWFENEARDGCRSKFGKYMNFDNLS